MFKGQEIRFATDELEYCVKQSVYADGHLSPQLKKLRGITIAM